MRLYKHATIFQNDKLSTVDILTDKGKITQIDNNINAPKGCEILDYSAKFVLPALIDIHTHGADGYDFNLATLEQMLKIVDFYRKHGVGSIYPTVMTDSDEVICNQLANIAQLKQLCPEVKGIHLEGPFLSAEYCGAMPKELLQKPDIRKFALYQKYANNLIKMVTVAPELEGAHKFIQQLTDMGIVVSLGHSGADYATTMSAIKAGAKSFTHTLNAMKLPTQHGANIAGCALMADDCYCELICDGKHVSADMVNMVHKLKGDDKLILVTDSMMATGLKDGEYRLGANSVTVKEGDAMISGTNIRAGSTLTADNAFVNYIQYTKLPVNVAIKAMTMNPARLMGIYDSCGSIEVGKDADFFVLDGSSHAK